MRGARCAHSDGHTSCKRASLRVRDAFHGFKHPPQASPVVKKRIVTSRRAIPFKTTRVNDSTLSKGSNRVRSHGVRGVEILTYKITFRNGIQVHKELIRTVIVRAPVTRVIAVGTKETQ